MILNTRFIELDQENINIAEINKIDSINNKSNVIMQKKHTEILQNE